MTTRNYTLAPETASCIDAQHVEMVFHFFVRVLSDHLLLHKYWRFGILRERVFSILFRPSRELSHAFKGVFRILYFEGWAGDMSS